MQKTILQMQPHRHERAVGLSLNREGHVAIGEIS